MSPADTLKFFLPETILTVFSLGALLCSLTFRGRNASAALALLAVVLSALSLPLASHAPAGLYFHMLANDAFSIFFKAICLFATGLAILLSMGSGAVRDDARGEYYFLILAACVAMMLAVSSNHLLMIYLSIEMLSLVSYILVGFQKNDAFSAEGALKYFLFGALSTGIMLYGISLVIGLFGTADLSAICAALKAGQAGSITAGIAFLMIFAGISFKCALAPFHLWVPDAYQGAPTAVTAFISVGPKAAGFAVLLRLFAINASPCSAMWTHLLTLIAILTMTLGNLIAISQTNIKRMLAYSSIGQAGYILIGFVAGDSIGMAGVFYYVLAYALMNLGAFGCVTLISKCLKSDEIGAYAGLYKTNPFPAFMLTVFLLSLAGVPPLAGFFGKFLVFAAAVQSRLFFLALMAVINSVIAAFFYMKIIQTMYLRECPETRPAAPSTCLNTALLILLAGVLIVGCFPGPFLDAIAASQTVFMR